MNRVKCRRYIKRMLVVILAFSSFIMVRLIHSLKNSSDDHSVPGVGQLHPPIIVTTSSHVTNDVFGHVTQSVQSNITRWTSTDESGRCVFQGSFKDSINKLRQLKFNSSVTWMRKLGFDRLPGSRTTSLPVLVTGANGKFFGVLQGLVKSIHEKLLPKYPDLKLVVYDMGFSKQQNTRLKKYCRCEVRRMPFEDMPKHVKILKNFAFKPIIMNYIFQEFGHVWWVDSSVRFTTNSLEAPLQYLQENGALFFTYGPELNVAFHTHKDTFRYFQEDPCPYLHFGEMEAGNIAIINNDVGTLILNRWVSCALDASCLSPAGARLKCPKLNKKGQLTQMNASHVGLCHRYDQSVLSVILRRLYHEQNDYPAVEEPFRIIEVRRGQTVRYFPDS